MNISNNVCENWNSNNPSMVSFVGLESNNQRQFWDWETNNHNNTTITTTNNNDNPFISNHPTTNIFDCGNISSSSPSIFAANCLPTTQFADYHASSTDFMKKEADYHGSGGRIGLNLGHRTYFSSREIGLMDRLYKRPRGFYQANQIPRCQAEGCKIDLTNAKHYHRRHKVCELHSKATKVVAGGREQRFCQQCSRFHVLAEFDESKRSCRKRLADHNRRRRKLQPGPSNSVSTQISENAFPHVGPSSSRSELKVTSLSSSTILPSMISASTTNKSSTINAKGTIITSCPPSLSLGGQRLQQHQQHQQHHISSSSSSSSSYTTTNQRPFIINHDSTPLFDRENTVAPYHNLFFTSSNEASQSTTTGRGSDHHSQHPEELQNLLHLRQAMFEIELL